MSWSKTGASVAISYGSNENMSWSEHRLFKKKINLTFRIVSFLGMQVINGIG